MTSIDVQVTWSKVKVNLLVFEQMLSAELTFKTSIAW